jgi:hypothetical protein
VPSSTKENSPTLLSLTKQLDEQADLILNAAYKPGIPPSQRNEHPSMVAPMDPRFLNLTSILPSFATSAVPLNLHQTVPSFSLGLSQPLTAWPLTCGPLAPPQMYHLGSQAVTVQQGGYPFLTSLEQGEQKMTLGRVPSVLENHGLDISLEQATKKAPRGKSALPSTHLSDPGAYKPSTQGRRITPRLSELLTSNSVPAVPAETLGKRPSQHIQELKEKVTRLRMRKTEVDVRISMLQEENLSLNRQYQQLVETFSGGRLMAAPSVN